MTFESDVVTPSIYAVVKANKRVCEITDYNNFCYTDRNTFLQHYNWLETDLNNIEQHENPRMYFGATPCAEQSQETFEQGM